MKRHQAGFTLLEMIVALAIFSVVSLTGYQLLGGMLRHAEHSDRLAARLGEVQRMLVLLDRDLSQALIPASVSVLPPGEAAFSASSSAPVPLRLVRRNWLNPQQQARSSLQRVAWLWSDDTLTRVNISSGQPGLKFHRVRAVRLRFYAAGRWHSDWPAAHSLPEAVEVTVDVAPWGEIKQISLLTGAP